MTTLTLLKTKAQKTTHTTLDTLVVDAAKIKHWKNPPFQRPLRVNDKVRQLAEQIREDGGVIPGVVTLGILHNDTYLLDGQHRREAFLLSECKEAYVDVRRHIFDSMADMGEEFVNLNSQLVKLRPDDILRGLEASNAGLTLVRDRCPFVGYDMIRRGDRSPMLGMSQALRCWAASGAECPTSSVGSAASLASDLSTEQAGLLAEFLTVAEKTWGRDNEYVRLWGSLNLTIVMWLYRRVVLSRYSQRTQQFTKEEWKKCMLALSAASDYVDWLVGRQLGDRDRSPCFHRVKAIIAKRMEPEVGKKIILPQPPWVSSHGTHGSRG